ncbi:MAG: M6 family metalloprotease domain-containing protein [Chloroflexi bacterium]|nr:M6 family metalloprotease domain-containing protein [Chloroflexota bacterium]
MIQSLKKTSIALLIFIVLLTAQPTHTAHAAPPAPLEVTLYQPDGTAFQARAWGDEWSNGMETLDGYTIILDEPSQYWVYAALSSAQSLAPAPGSGPAGYLIVGRDAPAGLPRHIRPAVTRPAGSPATGFQPMTNANANIGTQRVLVLLVEFENRPPVGTDAAYWNNKIFGVNGSVRKYYLEASYGNLSLLPAPENYGAIRDGIIGWIKLPYNHPNSGRNISMRNQALSKDAILASAPYVDYSIFDSNNDGYVSSTELHIVVVAAGYETAFGASNACYPSLWAHYAGFDEVGAPEADGKIIGDVHNGGRYVQMGEWHCADIPGRNPGAPATIGIIAHELGHSLNLPDLYDVSGRSAGIGVWGLMGTGTWNTTSDLLGELPAYHDAWSKWYEGWVTPTQSRGLALAQSIPQAETSPVVYQLLDNPNGVDWTFQARSGSGEYFLVENRQLVGFDAALPGCGLLIWHIDEGVPFDNSANAGSPRRLAYLIQADGKNDLDEEENYGDNGDPFPGRRRRRIFDSSTDPNSNLYNGSPSSVHVTNIGNCAATMTANFLTPGPGTFADVPPGYWAADSIERLYRNGIAAGCGTYPLMYCPENSTSRAQMAVFLLRGRHGSGYTPPPASGTLFSDIPADHWAAAWIERLVAEGISSGCGDGKYCPDAKVTRAQMAILLLRSKYGNTYNPPPVTGPVFADVPAGYWAAAWIKQLVAEGITSGCGGGNYCPESAVTRAQMAVFLARTFDLP